VTQPSEGAAAPVRVLVVDDSPTVRAVLSRQLAATPGLEVVGTASDGLEALARAVELKPDVITLDVEMPRLDGLATLQRLMAEAPTRVVMVSSLTRDGAEATLKALELGAVDFIEKPSGAGSLAALDIAEAVGLRVREAASARLRRPLPARKPVAAASPAPAGSRRWGRQVVVVGSSTGGPPALRTLIEGLPADFGVPMVVVQHMPQGFTKSLAERLDRASAVTVREAAEGDRLEPGLVLVAPGGTHLVIDSARVVHLNDGPTECGVRPAINVTLESAATAFGRNVLSVVLTGMGNDGTRGAGLVRAGGGDVIAEAESTCVIYGMPRSIAEAGLASEVLPIDQIGDAVVRRCLATSGRQAA
jgi:two-component system chemotaxis response regulator CheB